MAMNRVQFQRSLPLPEFFKRYGTERQCQQALAQARWPQGFVCPRCQGTFYSLISTRTHPLYQCSSCLHQTSLIAGTIMQATKLPLTKWFLAMYLISQSKQGISAMALMRHLGVSYPSAWLMQHKLMAAMAQRDGRYSLADEVQLDDAYLGGELPGGKAGRGSENKAAFVAAVSLKKGRPRYAKFTPVGSFNAREVAPTVVGARKPRDLPRFKWINTVLGNLKTSLSGSYHAFDFKKYAHHYLAAFAYRFNRRFNMRELPTRLMVAAVSCPPKPERVIRAAEVAC